MRVLEGVFLGGLGWVMYGRGGDFPERTLRGRESCSVVFGLC